MTTLQVSQLSWALAAMPAVLAAAVGAFAKPSARAMQPRTATWAVTTFAVVAALCSTYALATMAAMAVGRLDEVADVGGWAPNALSGPSAAPLAVAAPTAVLLAAAVSWAVAMLSKAVATVVRVERLSRRPHSQRVTVIPSQHVDAYAVGGITGGQIVVTTAMLAELSEGEFGIMLEHENAHLRLRHHLFKTTVRLAVCLNPLLRPAAAAVEESAERWADECAARKVGDRRLVAQAVARAALAAHGRTPGASAVSRFGTSAVLMRVDSLLNPRSARRGSVAVAAAALVVAASLGSTALASMHTERVFEHAQHTYTATQ